MIRLFVVDDSSAVRKALTKFFSSDAAIEVVGTADSGEQALPAIESLRPDVISTDLNMPGMGGIELISRVVRAHPIPIIVVSSEPRKSASTAMEALRAGAVAVLPKPHTGYDITQMLKELRDLVVEAGRAKPRVAAARTTARQAPVLSTHVQVIAVGSSTGGTVAFETFAEGLPSGHPPVVLAQHLPPEFVPRFADRLSENLQSRVAVAQGGEKLAPNTIWIAPGTHHLQIRREGTDLVTELHDGPPVNFHRPSCDVLLESVARAAGRSAVGVILTGMGADGARGLLAMRVAGATTFAQDEESCVVYGMPRAAAELGAAQHVVAIDRMAAKVTNALAR